MAGLCGIDHHHENREDGDNADDEDNGISEDDQEHLAFMPHGVFKTELKLFGKGQRVFTFFTEIFVKSFFMPFDIREGLFIDNAQNDSVYIVQYKCRRQG